jgi:pre-mRNA-processing factor 40
MAADRRTANIDTETLQLIFQRIQEKAIRRNEDEKHAADRHQRRAVDALRSRIKHLEPPIRPTDAWAQVRLRIEKLEEFKAVESDELRQSAFEKVVRRLKEKEEDAEREREQRDRDRAPRRDNYDRADRDYRNGQSYRSDRRAAPSRVSRTPEPDPYEADRRKAQADRERSYRKVSGLSPVRDRRDDRERDRDRDRDRDREGVRDKDRDRDKERDRERDRDRRQLSHYERERRDREEERERLYRTRGDPRGSRDELDYGDSRSTVSTDRRRRRDSDAESVASRSAKRYRRDARERDRSPDRNRAWRREKERERRSRDRTPVGPEARKEEKAVHSGSEEGEIEED